MRRPFSCGVAGLMLSMSIVSPSMRREPSVTSRRLRTPIGRSGAIRRRDTNSTIHRSNRRFGTSERNSLQTGIGDNGSSARYGCAAMVTIEKIMMRRWALSSERFSAWSSVRRLSTTSSRTPPRLASTTLARSLTADADMARSIPIPAHILEMTGYATIVAERRSTYAS